MNIAILDTDTARKKSMVKCLSVAGFTCFSYLKKERFLAARNGHRADILILDIGLAKKGGKAFIEQSREKGIKKILLLTHSEKPDIIFELLTAGIDDFVCFALRQNELLTRISIMARQITRNTDQPSYLVHEDFVFECYPNSLKYRGKSIALTAREFDLAYLLFSHMGMPLSRAHIAKAIWKKDHNDMARTMDTHISRVRNKLNLKPQNGYLLEQIYGYGYQLIFLAKN